jgi:hypothetical protein
MLGYLANITADTPRADAENKTLNGFESKLKKEKPEETAKPEPAPKTKKNQTTKTDKKTENTTSLLGFKDSFNESLKNFFNKKFTGRFISCGLPSKILKSCGFENKEIIIKPATLSKKIKKHALSMKHLEDLPLLIAKPVMVFKSKKFNTSKVIVTDRKNKEGLLCIVIRTDSKMNQLEVHEINSIHGRNNIQLNLWKKDGLLIYEKKEKVANSIIGSNLNCSKSNTVNDSSKAKVKKDSHKSKKTQKTKKHVKKKQTKNPFVDGLQKPVLNMPKGEGTTLLSNWQPNTHIKALRSDLGAFMGGYERNRYAMVIRGEKGAGKSRLLMQAINLFAWEDLKCLFLSLEMSPESELFGEYLKYIEGKAKNNVAISANDSIDQLEEYCKKYDVIAVDSWGKLQNSDQWLLDRLMKKYPHVVWLIIFQSTTAGTARGGLGSEYDGSLVIQVAKGGNAQCEKNRYNSTDLVYNVFQQELIQTEDEN